MAHKHPWMNMRQGLMAYRKRLAAGGEPSRRQDDERGVDRQRPKPPRVGGLDREVGQDDRADDRHEQAQPDREDDREDVDRA